MAPGSETLSWAYLAVSLLGVAFTLNGLLPHAESRFLMAPRFFSSWLAIELALHQIAWQLAATALFGWGGAFQHAPGAVGLALTVGSWAGLLLLWVHGRRAGDTVVQALGDLAGTDAWPRVPAVKLLVPFSMSRKGVRVTRNVPYARVAGKTLKLDVFAPAQAGARRPAIVQIHGGGWVIGDKREQGLPLMNHMAAHGWVGFNVNYRLSPGATFPDHLTDVKRAIAWIRAHADEHGVDPEILVVTGGSAGGHLAALTALTENDPRYQPGFEEADTSVAGAVPVYAVYDFTDRLRLHPRVFVKGLLEPLVMKAFLDEEPEKFTEASPLDRIHEGAPPFFVIHGNRDTLAPVEYARLFVEKLRKASREPVVYAELHGAQHAFDIFASPRTARVVEGIERFCSALHRRCLAERGEAVCAPASLGAAVANVMPVSPEEPAAKAGRAAVSRAAEQGAPE